MVPNSLIARLTSSFSYYKCSRIQLSSVFHHNAFPFSFNSFSSSTSSSDSESDADYCKGDTYTISYLTKSCGLSPDSAKKLSIGLNLKDPDGPNAVLDLLKNYGFSKTQVAKLVGKHPLLLFANAKRTLLPKLKFLHSIGVSTTDMPQVLIANHILLVRSLKNCIVPRYKILRGVLRNDQEAARALRNAPRAFTYCDIMNKLVQNIEFLRQFGVPQSSISLMVVNFPSATYIHHSKFVEAVKTVKEIGLDPSKTTFVMAVQVLLGLSQAAWESRFEFFHRWGWDREMTLQAFRKFPNFMKLSQETVAKKMSYMVNDMGWTLEDVAGFPPVLGFSLEKRIIPRLSVIKVLKSKGLIKNDMHLSSFMCSSEEVFLKKFVINFQDDAPLLTDVYKGLIDHQDVI